MSDPSELVIDPVVRTVGGATYQLRKIPSDDLWPWLAEEKKARREQAIRDVPATNVTPVVRQQLIARAQSVGMTVEELRPLVLEGPGAFRSLRLAAKRAGVPEDDVDGLIESAGLTQNLRDGAAVSGLFRRDELDGYFPEYADDPVRLMVGAIATAMRGDPAELEPDQLSALFDAARSRVEAAAVAGRDFVDARQRAVIKPAPASPNGPAPTTSDAT